ncbi:MAG: nucleotidyltransferase family protein [Bacteroidales bacterium]|nr:nucleotidyltransferase family protein [Bacteroidales bacterium]
MHESVQIVFLRLLACGLWGRAPERFMEMSEAQWEELHRLAQRQGVLALVYDGLCTPFPSASDISDVMLGTMAASPVETPGSAGTRAAATPGTKVTSVAAIDMMPVELAVRWATEVLENERGYERMASVIELQRRAWEKRGLEAVLQKGHSVAAYYPVPEHRSCGDIDWYFPRREDFRMACRVAQENGLELKWDSDGDVSYTLSGMVVEHHRKGMPQDTPEQMLLMLEDHVLKHAMVMGVGLKQVCDVAILRHAVANRTAKSRTAANRVSVSSTSAAQCRSAASSAGVTESRPHNTSGSGWDRQLAGSRWSRLLARAIEHLGLDAPVPLNGSADPAASACNADLAASSRNGCAFGLAEPRGRELQSWRRRRELRDAQRLAELILEDGNMGLDKENRFSGFAKRAALFLRYAPVKFLSRWLSLICGRLLRLLHL